MTQIPGGYFKGILFQLRFAFCSQKPATGDTKRETSKPAPLQSQAQHTQGWQRHTGALLPCMDGQVWQIRQGQPLHLWVFFGLVGLLFASSSSCNDPLPAPAVHFLGTHMKKKKTNKTQTNSWMVKVFAPLYTTTTKSKEDQNQAQVKTTSPEHLLSKDGRFILYSIPACWPFKSQTPSESRSSQHPSQSKRRCRLARSLHCQLYVQPQRHPKTLRIVSAERQMPHLNALTNALDVLVLPTGHVSIYSTQAESTQQALLKSYDMIKYLNL